MSNQDVFNAVGAAFSVAPGDITGPTRPRNIAEARHLAAYIMRHSMRMSNSQIGRALNRCHSCAILSIKRATNLLETDKGYRAIAAKAYNQLGVAL